MSSLRLLFALLLLAGCASEAKNASKGDPTRIAELERENAQLREEVAILEARNRFQVEVAQPHLSVPLGQLPPESCVPAVPRIVAKVLLLDRAGKTVGLDRGSRDGVELGYVFILYRGRTYKGRVRITEVMESTSVGSILDEKAEFAPGDSGTTVL